MNRQNQLLVSLFLLVLSFSFCISGPRSKSKSTRITGASLWTISGDSSDVIGNYHSLNLLNQKRRQIPRSRLWKELPHFIWYSNQISLLQQAKLFELGDIKVFDSLLVHGMDTTTLDFDGNKPKIVTLPCKTITLKPVLVLRFNY